MNETAGGRRRWYRPRRASVLAVTAGLVLLTAACGGSPSSAGTSGASSSFVSHELAFARCVRAHGVPKFPDPKFSGNKVELSIRTKDGSVNLNPDAPAFKAAEKVCQSKLADVMGGGPRTAQKAGK